MPWPMSINVLPVLQAYPLLTRVSPRLQGRIRSELTVMHADDGQEFFGVGDPCTAFPLIVGGGVRVLMPQPSGRALPLYTLAPGELCVLSVSCLLGDHAYPASGSAAGEVVAATLPKALFHTLLDEDAVFRKEVFGAFAMRFCLLMALIEEMSMTRLDERLADLLIARGPVIHSTHQALADELGTAREVVSRILEHFEAAGLVELHRAQVHVVDAVHLAESYALRQID
jgi:CRP/FNR family transcriptional regulator